MEQSILSSGLNHSHIIQRRQMEYQSAGCLFTDKQSFLAGFQRKQQKWTSFGGKKYYGETPFMTAIREVVEEIFELRLSQQTLAILICTLPFSFQHHDDNYVYYIYNFDVIFQIADILQSEGYQSPLYDSWPCSLRELLYNRKENITSEMERLALFKKEDVEDLQNSMDAFFYKDLSKLFSDSD